MNFTTRNRSSNYDNTCILVLIRFWLVRIESFGYYYLIILVPVCENTKIQLPVITNITYIPVHKFVRSFKRTSSDHLYRRHTYKCCEYASDTTILLQRIFVMVRRTNIWLVTYKTYGKTMKIQTRVNVFHFYCEPFFVRQIQLQ